METVTDIRSVIAAPLRPMGIAPRVHCIHDNDIVSSVINHVIARESHAVAPHLSFVVPASMNFHAQAHARAVDAVVRQSPPTSLCPYRPSPPNTSSRAWPIKLHRALA
ncbi:hypothetical protein K470DRAFT_149022 [Piedraia hortae CBS 480.64]|uniref:Uncharacterized protein n=1 Tax=Piedraia hortae CBS 480.64 TaxID=1314780 RepID=A0A6A7BRV6_9PEZI|nr:hypothetical protein K470DRAFT_149022 [Piedraia hortae CBS 480.64]